VEFQVPGEAAQWPLSLASNVANPEGRRTLAKSLQASFESIVSAGGFDVDDEVFASDCA
jgi:hypothetical protein